MLFYARSDTQRRQLLHPSDHFAAVQAMYRPRFDVVSWDDFWSGGSRNGEHPSVDEQVHIVRNSARIISPHGTFTSVWSFFLQPGAIVFELTASCYVYTWLPVPYLTRGRQWRPVSRLQQPTASYQLSLRHIYLSWRLSDVAKSRNWSEPLLELVHPRTGKAQPWTSPWCCCNHLPRESDHHLQLPPGLLTRGLRLFEASNKQSHVFKASEF